MSYNNPLIYGKNETERVVNIEIEDDIAYIYIQKEDGSIEVKLENNYFWLLAHHQLNENFTRLDGDLHYKYAASYTTREDFERARRNYSKDDTYSVYNDKEAFMLYSGYTYFKGLKHNEIKILAFDIETTGLKHDKDSKVLIISNTFRDEKGNLERKLFAYDEFSSDKEMFDSWCSWVRQKNPSVMLGHNIYGFDLPYMDFCASKAGTSISLGRNSETIKFNFYESKFRKDGSQSYSYKKCFIKGVEILDTMFLSIKYDTGRKYESYGLKQIIAYEGLEVQNRVFYDASQIRFNYRNKEEWKKIKAYAEFDADDALALYDLMVPSFFYMTQSIPKSFQEVICTASGSQLNAIMVRAYLQDVHSLPKASPPAEYEGAISFGKPGIYRNVFKVDAVSLYPSIMIQYEVFDREKDPKGYFKQLVETFTRQRIEHKQLAKTDKYYDDLQNSEKIFINSAYGFLGAVGLLFNSPNNAAFITEKGREVLNKSIKWAEDKKFVVANGDTDSVSISKSDQTSFSYEERAELLMDLNSNFPSRIKFEADGYFECFVVLKAKNYILYSDNKIKNKGSALKSSKTEIALKEFLNEIILAVIKETNNYTEIFNKYVKEIMDVKDIKRWASKKTITEKVQTSERANETKVMDAIAGSDYQESDKVYVFFKNDDSLCLIENFTNDYNKEKLLKKLFKTAQIFANILNIDELFLDYSLKRNKVKLQELMTNE